MFSRGRQSQHIPIPADCLPPILAHAHCNIVPSGKCHLPMPDGLSLSNHKPAGSAQNSTHHCHPGNTPAPALPILIKSPQNGPTLLFHSADSCLPWWEKPAKSCCQSKQHDESKFPRLALLPTYAVLRLYKTQNDKDYPFYHSVAPEAISPFAAGVAGCLARWCHPHLPGNRDL